MALRWERQGNETIKAYEAFCVYRDFGIDRSVVKAYRKKSGKDSLRAIGRWNDWSSRFDWPSRAAAYEEYLEAIERAAREKKIGQLAERRAAYELRVQDLLENAVERIDRLLVRVERKPVADTIQKEDGETVVAENGEITKKPTVIKRIKGMNLSALARLRKELRETAREAVNGPRPPKADEPNARPPSPLDLTRLDDDDLRTYRALIAKAALEKE